MAAITWTNVTNHAAALSAVATDARTDILALVNGNGVAVDKFDGEAGETTKLARIYLAAHFGAMSLRGATGGSGTVTQMSEGGVSISYSQMTAAQVSDTLADTPYGKLFAALIARSPKLRGFLVA
jgi:hypothetical protein